MNVFRFAALLAASALALPSGAADPAKEGGAEALKAEKAAPAKKKAGKATAEKAEKKKAKPAKPKPEGC